MDEPIVRKNPSPVSLEASRGKGGSRKRTAEAVFAEVTELVNVWGVNRLCFYTFTFPDQVRNRVEAQERWHSLRTNVLKDHWERAVVVSERTKDGKVHYHAIAVLKRDGDVRGDFDFTALERSNRIGVGRRDLTARYSRSATETLRAEWAFWRENAAKYSFGRVQVTPIKSEKGAPRYVAKYLTKASNERTKDDQGARLVRFVGYRRQLAGRKWESTRTRLSNGWAWATKGGALWRAKAAWAAGMFPGVVCELSAKKILGRRWAFILGQLGQFAPRSAIPKWLQSEEDIRQSKRAVHEASILAEVHSALAQTGKSFSLLEGTPFRKVLTA